MNILRGFCYSSSLSLILYSGFAKAEKDQAIQIVVSDTQSCVSDVLLRSPHDNCKEIDVFRGPCKNDRHCICMKPDKHVEWETSHGGNFEIVFKQESPFKKCGPKSKKGKLKCKLSKHAPEGDFEYDVKLEGCPEYDPRIVIRY